MVTIKSLIKYDNANCIEVTWVETKTITLPQEEISEGVSDLVLRQQEVETVIHCQAYADVQMDMLRADALKYNTPLDEYESIIKEVESNIVLPTPEEIAEQEKQAKLQECDAYLKNTDWVEPYLLKHYTGLELLNENSYKFEIERLRKEAIQFIRDNK